jgi:hypothetical protein
LTTPNTGGAAFPRPDTIVPEGEAATGVFVAGEPGMSLFDYFAGLAMQGMLTQGKPWIEDGDNTTDRNRFEGAKRLARRAYLIASGMLFERARLQVEADDKAAEAALRERLLAAAQKRTNGGDQQ